MLPFVNVGGTADAEHFSEGLADEILTRLNAVSGLSVVARTSSFSFKGSGDDVRSIAARLRVAHVLEGSVRRSGEQIRINAQLIDAQRGYQVWSDRYDGVLGEIFSLQDDIANAIVTSLQSKVPSLGRQAAITTRPPTTNLAAYELLLRGRQYLNRRDEQSLRRSVDLFRQAIELDESYGQAYVELAKSYALLPAYSSELQSEMFDLAMATRCRRSHQGPSRRRRDAGAAGPDRVRALGLDRRRNRVPPRPRALRKRLGPAALVLAVSIVRWAHRPNRCGKRSAQGRSTCCRRS